jgi:hypothetical protein
MYIHNPVADFISKMVASRQKYRCQVDGRDEFQGEKLPVGTKKEVLSWIKDRFKLVDEFGFIDGVEFSEVEVQPISQHIIYFCCNPLALQSKSWLPEPFVLRYRVDVGGAEKIFVLNPIPERFLEYHPPKQLM